jgi:predicted GNAT family acetyltransferase
MADVTDNPAAGRYEMVVDGATAFVTYVLQGDRLTLLHTEVPPLLGGRGIGSSLATAVFENARGRGLRIVPECEFIAAFIKRHPRFSDLVVGPDDAP